MDSKTHAENKPEERASKLEGLSLLEPGDRGLIPPAGAGDPTPLTRRQFNRLTARLLGGAALGLALPSCKKKKEPEILRVEPPEPEPDTLTEAETVSAFFAGTDTSFPMLEVGGKPYDIGRVIGRTFAEDIRKGFEKRMAWWKELKEFANAQPKSLYDTFEAAARKHTPTVYEELRGWADGCGFPLRDLMILNLKAEYGAMLDESRRKKAKSPPGCSTIVLKDGKRILVAHNEDGDPAYLEHMFMLKVRPESGVSFLCASYPGILPGNAPWVNDRGVVMTTNFIYTKEVKPGVGRYFLDRLSMEAKTIEEALAVCRHPERAYAFHHVIGSVPESRVVSLEVTPTLEALTEIDGVFIHTNHLIAPSLAKEAQDEDYVSTSSRTRWDVLSAWKEGLPENVSEVTVEQIINALTSHEGKPYSPCRHPEGDVRGATLLTALLNLGEETMRIYKLQPCNNKVNDYDFPGG